MNKTYLLFIMLIVATNLKAQRSVDGMVQTEKNFAAYSVAHGTREAFLQFLDSNGIVFTNGTPVNGMQLWGKREHVAGILDWHPQYAAIALSGDFGFTSGPWTFRSTQKDTIAARGNYTTVWHIDAHGAWKFLVDLGAGNSPAGPDAALTVVDISTGGSRGKNSSLLENEKEFIALSNDPEIAYKKYLSKDALLNRNGALLQFRHWKAESFPHAGQYSILGSAQSDSGDLGYVYGTVLIDGKKDNYLRIWKTEADGWRILVEVLRY
jgi:ketosteroid isomerase-like protein